MTELSVNLNKIALLRNARDLGEPNVIEFARLSLDNGAYGVTIHPRPDQRHATYQDAVDLQALVKADYPNAELNIEGYPDDKWMETVLAVKPHQATLVPDLPDQLTSDHGWDLLSPNSWLEERINAIADAGVRVSLFLDPVIEQVNAAKQTRAHRIELYTEPYAKAFRSDTQTQVLNEYTVAAQHAATLGLGVNAGHDLNLENIQVFREAVPVLEVSIGHALTCEALLHGFSHTVREYVKRLK